MSKVERINGHGHHELDFLDTPDNLFPFVSKYIHKNVEKNGKRVQNLLKALDKVIPGEKLRYLYQYLDTIDNTDEERLQEDLQYHDMVFSICVDLHYMGAGKCAREYDDQIASAVHLKKTYGERVKVFVMLDPNRPCLYDLAKKWHNHIDGWKLYPTWYYVTDIRLRAIFRDFPLPVVVHCTDTSPIAWEGSRSELKKKLGENASKYRALKSKKWNCQFFSHPKYVYEMSVRYPNINWSCEHMGGKNKEYRDYILERLGGNFYACDCFTYTDIHELLELIPILEGHDNIKHGTDFFMTLVKTDYAVQIANYNKYVPKKLKDKQVKTTIRFVNG